MSQQLQDLVIWTEGVQIKILSAVLWMWLLSKVVAQLLSCCDYCRARQDLQIPTVHRHVHCDELKWRDEFVAKYSAMQWRQVYLSPSQLIVVFCCLLYYPSGNCFLMRFIITTCLLISVNGSSRQTPCEIYSNWVSDCCCSLLITWAGLSGGLYF